MISRLPRTGATSLHQAAQTMTQPEKYLLLKSPLIYIILRSKSFGEDKYTTSDTNKESHNEARHCFLPDRHVQSDVERLIYI